MTEQPILTAPTAAWNYDWATFRPGSKCMLLTEGGIAILGQLPSADHDGYMAWSPMPQRDKAREAELGLRLGGRRR